MKLLILDSKSFKYKLDHKTPVGEDIGNDLMIGNFDNPLVVFVAIEAGDNEATLEKSKNDISKIAIKNNVDLVLLNPFAHLASNLAKPAVAINLLKELTDMLKQCSEFSTEKLVFGWYKEFSIDVKGGDNSQIFREY